MANRYVVFSHGKDSDPWGRKITALADVARGEGYEVESVDYRGIDTPRGLAAARARCVPDGAGAVPGRLAAAARAAARLPGRDRAWLARRYRPDRSQHPLRARIWRLGTPGRCGSPIARTTALHQVPVRIFPDRAGPAGRARLALKP